MAANLSAPPGVPVPPQEGDAPPGVGHRVWVHAPPGTAGCTVPLDLLPGRNGLTPRLGLVYSTRAGHGPFGLGWALDLDLGEIQRDDREDRLLLTGTGELVPVPGEG